MTTAHSLLLMQSIQEHNSFYGIWNTFPSICIHLDQMCGIINLRSFTSHRIFFFLFLLKTGSSVCYSSVSSYLSLMTNSSCGVII